MSKALNWKCPGTLHLHTSWCQGLCTICLDSGGEGFELSGTGEIQTGDGSYRGGCCCEDDVTVGDGHASQATCLVPKEVRWDGSSLIRCGLHLCEEA